MTSDESCSRNSVPAEPPAASRTGRSSRSVRTDFSDDPSPGRIVRLWLIACSGALDTQIRGDDQQLPAHRLGVVALVQHPASPPEKLQALPEHASAADDVVLVPQPNQGCLQGTHMGAVHSL